MRTIERSSTFKKDYQRVKATPRHRNLDLLLTSILTLLLSDKVLPRSNRDHALSGDFFGYRECHVKPDLLLIYQKQNTDILKLVRLGSHSELFK